MPQPLEQRTAATARSTGEDDSGRLRLRVSEAGLHSLDDDLLLVAWDPAGADPWLRFRTVWAVALAVPGSQVPRKSLLLAARLGVHPTSLSRTNFKLSPAAWTLASQMFGVTQAFLQHGALSESPAWLARPLQVAALIRQAASQVALSLGGDHQVTPLAEEILLTHDAESGLAAMPDIDEYAREFRQLWRMASALIASRIGHVTVQFDSASCQGIQQALLTAIAQRSDSGIEDPLVRALIAVRRAVAQSLRGDRP